MAKAELISEPSVHDTASTAGLHEGEKTLCAKAGLLYNQIAAGVCQGVDLATETRWCRQIDWQALFQAFSS
jgi:hypothetical protein